MQSIVKERLCVCISFVSLVFSSTTILSRMSQCFYAVGRGRQVGVYATWAECQKQVEKIANAKYKKFNTHKEAVAFIQECKEKYSPHKSPSKTGFLRDSVILSTASAPVNVYSQRSSSVQHPRLPINMSSTQPVASKSVSASQSLNRNNVIQAFRTCETESEKQKRLSPTTLSAVQSLAEEDPFMPETLQRSVHSRPESSMNNTGIDGINLFFEKVDKHFTEIKTTLGHVLLKLNNLENKVQELSFQNATGNQNVGIQNACGSGVKRSLFETYNIPQPLGSRSFSTTQPEEEVEVVPVPPKKIPKIELNSDDEVDGFAHDFRVDTDGYVIVYTDGACEKNGRLGAKAGIGVWFGDGHPLNVSEPVHGRATNNTAEIQAVVQALEIAKRAGVKRIIVHTDSEFTINCITKWVKKWVKNKWKVASGADVKNKEDLILLLEAMKNIDVKWEHVRGHHGIHGNEMADRLARTGAERYKP